MAVDGPQVAMGVTATLASAEQSMCKGLVAGLNSPVIQQEPPAAFRRHAAQPRHRIETLGGHPPALGKDAGATAHVVPCAPS